MKSSSIEKFARALKTLRRFATTPVEDDRDAAGVIHAFEFTYELAWKSAAQATASLGYTERGPRPSLVNAFDTGLIPAGDAEVWAEMGKTRNMTVHTYSDTWALSMVAPIRDRFLEALERFEVNVRPYAKTPEER